MKRPTLLILASFVLVLQISCSEGGGGSSSGSYTTHVEIVLGRTHTVSLETGTPIKARDQIPASVFQIRFTISAPDMQTIIRSIAVAGRPTITESFEVPVGVSRRFLVESLDSEGNVIFRGEAAVNVGAEPLYLTISLVNTDPLSPVFSGLSTITGITTTTMVLNWSPATDNVTDPGKIQYLIYATTSPSEENFVNPTFASSPGATSYTVTRLNPATIYYFVVRAMDEHGNIDGNTVERSATTLSNPDIDPPVFSGLSTITGITTNTVVLNWSPATDNVTDPGRIQYLIYAATSPSGENFVNPTFASSPGATSYVVTNLAPATTYYFVVRARDQQGNVDGNSVERSATTLSMTTTVVPTTTVQPTTTTTIPADTTPPIFAGLEQAIETFVGNGRIVSLSWAAATDYFTPQSAIVYRIYMATSPGFENFSSPSYVTTPGQTSYSISGVPTTEGGYYFVVRAVDAAGNEDTNTVERRATPITPIPGDL